MQSLDPRYIQLFFWRLTLSFMLIFTPFIFFFLFPLFFSWEEFPLKIIYFLIVLSVFACFCAGFLSLFWFISKWNWRFFKYELKEDGFWRESGIIWKSYCTIPYSRIQNIDLYRNPLERLLGLSRLHIQTAGNNAYPNFAEGKVPGLSVEVAEKLRKELVRRSNEFKQLSSDGI